MNTPDAPQSDPQRSTAAKAREVAVILTAAEEAGLPLPSIVTLYDHAVTDVPIHFATLEALTDWATWQEASITERPTELGDVHYGTEFEMGGLRVGAVYIAPAPTSTVSAFTCSSCDAQFGIAGEHSGSDDDYAADEYYDAQVEYHESGECMRTAVAL